MYLDGFSVQLNLLGGSFPWDTLLPHSLGSHGVDAWDSQAIALSFGQSPWTSYLRLGYLWAGKLLADFGP